MSVLHFRYPLFLRLQKLYRFTQNVLERCTWRILPDVLFQKIADYAVEGRQASVLQKWLDTFNTSREDWTKYANRVYFYDKRVIVHKRAHKTDENGNEIVILHNMGVAPYKEHQMGGRPCKPVGPPLHRPRSSFVLSMKSIAKLFPSVRLTVTSRQG